MRPTEVGHTGDMSDAPDASTDPTEESSTAATPAEPVDAEIEAFDLDGDGKISIVEAERARLGVVDARLEEIAEHDQGLKGKLAKAAHEVLDKLDND